jgi:hypothetical protein
MGTSRIALTALAISLLAAGLMHLVLTAEHMQESAILGIGFVVAALAQIVLGLLALRPNLAPYGWIIALNAVLIVLFAAHATTGLPLPDAQADATSADRGVFGPLEAVDAGSIVTKASEIVGIALAAWLRRERTKGSEITSMRRAA